MRSSKLRVATALAVIAVVAVGFVTNFGIGTVSAIGWSDLSLLCPLGALGTMLATKAAVPRAVISLVFAVLFIIVFARAFCGWLCPVPIVSRLRTLFSKKPSPKVAAARLTPDSDLASSAQSASPPSNPISDACGADAASTSAEVPVASACAVTPLTDAEKKVLVGSNKTCSSCTERRGRTLDARHFVLGGSLLSAAVFGFPVFCLICPIGLTFATILLVMRLFGGGDVTWSLIVVPLILVAEVVLFRKWCSKLCPLSAFMSLIGKANRTFVPAIDDKTCIETARGRTCGVCAKVCPENIDPRHPERGSAASECTKCRACVDACPTKSITMPFLPKRKDKPVKSPEASDSQGVGSAGHNGIGHTIAEASPAIRAAQDEASSGTRPASAHDAGKEALA